MSEDESLPEQRRTFGEVSPHVGAVVYGLRQVRQREWTVMANKNSEKKSAVVPPAGAGGNWQDKIAKAKAARDHGKTLRAGKPGSFRSAVGRSR